MKIVENAIASIAPQDATALQDVENIIFAHALGASGAAAASCILPGAGEAIAPVVALTFTGTMYYRVAKRMGLDMPRNVLKAIASVVIAETSAVVAAALGLAAVISFLPGIGTGGAIMIGSIAVYMMVEAAGKMFLMILSKLFRAKTHADIEKMSEDELRDFAKALYADYGNGIR